jgi:hypothetical protein
MKITITPTHTFTELNGQPARLWRGITEHGTRCDVFVRLLRVHYAEDTQEFDAELESLPPPAEALTPLNVIDRA